MTKDQLDAIRVRVEKAKSEHWYKVNHGLKFGFEAVEIIPALLNEVERLTRERDAAVKDLSSAWLCGSCKTYAQTKKPWAYCNKHLYVGDTCMNFEWRGAREVGND
jgi:hypothetical protein